MIHELTLQLALLKDGVHLLALRKEGNCSRLELVESRLRELQELVAEQEQVRDLISQESVERATCIERLMQSLGNTN
jgi:hypothetical protein